ncbi:MAG: AmmeMemoRadiSam system protein B [Desulfobacteraceae bacterium]|nr:AmmeMemoRadiSam system protein B [Desulfobacteraceae bacterium]MBC2755615.1 AmmeMemoRadiSam system protein B [Desulfobacteraceae bacterium]
MKTRKSSFSGSWYPANASDCEKEIKNFLKESRFQTVPESNYIGGIVPHAGWYFSGSLACHVISALSNPDENQQPDVIVVFGMHMHPSSTPCIMTEGAWETPFGDIEIDSELAGSLAKKFSFNIETAAHFSPDNTIELQLPFIKYFFNTSRLIPIGVPPAGKTLDIAQSLANMAQQSGLTIKVVGSTDLTHYGSNYGFTPVGTSSDAVDWVRDHNDRKAIDRMLEMNPEGLIAEGLAHQNACCSGAAAAAIAAATALGAKQSHYIGYSSSYEKHPGDSFVGYAGILFH